MFKKIKLLILSICSNAYTQGGKIYNCEENSFVWFHEMGHIKQLKNKNILKILSYSYNYTPLIIIFAYLIKNDILFLITALQWLLINLWLEIDAWIYAFKNFKE